jgi:uncharacterized coiled-coil protein SlyX
MNTNEKEIKELQAIIAVKEKTLTALSSVIADKEAEMEILESNVLLDFWKLVIKNYKKYRKEMKAKISACKKEIKKSVVFWKVCCFNIL